MNDPVTPPSPNRAESIFAIAIDLPPEDRENHIVAACKDSPDLLAEVRALIAAHDAAPAGFLDAPEEGSFGETISATDRGTSSGKTSTPVFQTAPVSSQSGLNEKESEVIGPYKLLQQIGEGGFGTVWMAEQKHPISRRVALKIIKLGMDTKEVIARFEAERQALAMMDHPNIAKVLDAGATARGRPFFVMELVKGMPITKYCDEAGLSTRERLALFGDVCAAIQHAHQKGIIHRDIKPSNVLVTLYADRPVVKVIDFGIAKATQGKLTDRTLFTRFEQFIGTPVYMSPEQANFSAVDIDTRSDIYALGILLYELLTGKPPFDAQTLMSAGYDEMRRVIRDVEPPKPSLRLGTIVGEERTTIARARKIDPDKLGRLVEADLDWIVMKAIDKDRTRRYETAGAFAADITRHLQNEVISAHPPNLSYLLGKLIRRHKLAFATGAAIAASLVLGLTVSVWQAIRATRAEELANKEAQRATAAERLAIDEAARAVAAEKNMANTLVEVAAERDAKDQARKDAEAVSTFLTQVFQSPEPTRDGRTITVAEALDAAAAKLETDLVDQPDRRVKLQWTLGSTYHALGLYREAISLRAKVRDYHLATSGSEHLDTLSAMENLAISHNHAGRWNEAIELQEEILKLHRKLNGPEHGGTIGAMNALAQSYSNAGRRDEALKLREDMLALGLKVFGPEHGANLAAINKLAQSYAQAGQRDKALQMLEELQALHRKVSGPEHGSSLVAMSTLAQFYFTDGRRDEALQLREEALALGRKVIGPEHPDTLIAMNDLAFSYHQVGRKEEALKLREDVLNLRRKVSGPEHPQTLVAMYNLANSYADADRLSKALKLREEGLALRSKVLGPEHPETLWAMHELVYKHTLSAHRIGELTETVLENARNILAKPDSEWSADDHQRGLRYSLSRLAIIHRTAGRLDEVCGLQEQHLTVARKILGPEHAETLRLIEGLAESYTDASRIVDALPLFAAAAAGNPQDTGRALKVAALMVWFGRNIDHETVARRLLDSCRDATAPDDLERVAKINCLRPISNAARAEAALGFARKAAALGGENPAFVPWAQLTLGMAEYRSGHFADAITALKLAEQESPATQSKSYEALIADTSGFFRAMSLLRHGRHEESRVLFAELQSRMKPLPADKTNPLAGGANADNIILWLAHNEAKSLLENSTPRTSAKP